MAARIRLLGTLQFTKPGFVHRITEYQRRTIITSVRNNGQQQRVLQNSFKTRNRLRKHNFLAERALCTNANFRQHASAVRKQQQIAPGTDIPGYVKQFSCGFLNGQNISLSYSARIPARSFSLSSCVFSSDSGSSSSGESGSDGAAASSGDGEDGDGGDDATAAAAPESVPGEKFGQPVSPISLSPITVPEFWPQVPVIAISRNPVFPRFIKMIEV